MKLPVGVIRHYKETEGRYINLQADLLKLVEEVRADEPEMSDTVQAHAIYFGKNEVLKEIEKLLEGE